LFCPIERRKEKGERGRGRKREREREREREKENVSEPSLIGSLSIPPNT